MLTITHILLNISEIYLHKTTIELYPSSLIRNINLGLLKIQRKVLQSVQCRFLKTNMKKYNKEWPMVYKADSSKLNRMV